MKTLYNKIGNRKLISMYNAIGNQQNNDDLLFEIVKRSKSKKIFIKHNIDKTIFIECDKNDSEVLT